MYKANVVAVVHDSYMPIPQYPTITFKPLYCDLSKIPVLLPFPRKSSKHIEIILQKEKEGLYFCFTLQVVYAISFIADLWSYSKSLDIFCLKKKKKFFYWYIFWFKKNSLQKLAY